MDIYYRHDNRPVDIPNGHEDEVLASVRRLSARCQENFLMVDLELRRNDPFEGRCGLLNDRIEFYAVPIPQCAHARMVVSIDFRGARRRPAMQHGAVPNRGACDAAYALVVRHRRLVNPIRED